MVLQCPWPDPDFDEIAVIASRFVRDIAGTLMASWTIQSEACSLSIINSSSSGGRVEESKTFVDFCGVSCEKLVSTIYVVSTLTLRTLHRKDHVNCV